MDFKAINDEWRWKIAVLEQLEGIREALQRLAHEPKQEESNPASPPVVGHKRGRKKREVNEDGNMGESGNKRRGTRNKQ